MRIPYYYIVCYDVKGHDYLISGGVNNMPATKEEVAREKAFMILKGERFEIVSFPTPSLATANKMFKHKRLMSSGNIGTAVERVRHTAPKS